MRLRSARIARSVWSAVSGAGWVVLVVVVVEVVLLLAD